MLSRITRLPNVALAVLGVVTLVLSIFALRSSTSSSEALAATTSLPPAAAGTSSPGTPTAGSSTNAGNETSAGTASQEPAPTPAVVTDSVAAVSTTTAWRITTGTCADGGATLEVTTTGGRNWKTVPTPYTRLVRVQPTSATDAFVVGSADTGCGLGVRSTSDGGASWSAEGSTAQAWARDLKSPTVLHAPGVGSRHPCGKADVLDFSRADATHAAVLCSDVALRTTSDSGQTWPVAKRIKGAVAVLSSSNGTYAVTPSASASCQGLRVTGATGGASSSCVTLADPAPPGTVSGSIVGTTAWLRVGSRTFLSTDGLSTWKEAVA